MIHSPLIFQDVALSFPQKTCFEGFSALIHPGSRIGIMGQNGAGKSTLLKMIQGKVEPTQGVLKIPGDARCSAVPQIVEDFQTSSGGERLNKALSQALITQPNLLLLDEPTNHLDRENRQALLRFLRSYRGTLIIVTHDPEVLRTCMDTLWHIENGKIHIFQGAYDDYQKERQIQRHGLEKEIEIITREKKAIHQDLMREQKRAKTSRLRGEKHIEQRKWPTVVSVTKVRQAVETSGRKSRAIGEKKQDLVERLGNLRMPEILTPTFTLTSGVITDRVLVSVQDGAVGYDHSCLTHVNLSLKGGERLALCGPNGSGKTTLLKAIAGDKGVIHAGTWHTPNPQDIGVLDQHYGTLDPNCTVLETLQECAPHWSHAELRKHLNDFLFRQNEEVNACVSTLSGGEKARLSLAQIAARTPKLLLLDEITNNLDRETKDHVVQILNAYPGSLIVISHDEDFLQAIEVEVYYDVKKGVKI